MVTDNRCNDAIAALRRQAEQRVPADRVVIEAGLSSEAARQILYELQVHQVELEMQNEELRRSQSELAVAKAKYFDLYDLAPVGYCTIDEHGVILEANLTFAALLGMGRGELVRQRLTSFIAHDDQDCYYQHCRHLQETGAPQTCELRMARRDGTQFWVRIETTIVRDIDGKPISRTMISDITERRKIEKAMARLDQLNLIGQIAASLGHEVRNPMTTVRGFLQLFMDNSQYASDREYLELMIAELDRANSIITEFLTLAKDKRSPTTVQRLNSILSAMEPLLASDALRTGCDFKIEYGEIPALILDEQEVRQLIVNLVRNAIEAAPTGKVEVKTFIHAGHAVLTISDTGTGIPSEVLSQLGTPFLTTKDGGIGLGLATCYSIARRHRATIATETGPQGTTFTVRFPVPDYPSDQTRL